MENEVKQFNAISNKYSSFVDEDPVRNFLHYPSVIKLLGDIQKKSILDIGCGDGLFARKLAKEYGAHVVGYDKASDLISIAKNNEDKDSLGNKYFVADPISFQSDDKFDSAVSVMVLPYSPDEKYLVNFFSSAFKVLKQNGNLISVIFSPTFKSFGEIVANRIFKKLTDNKVEVNFLEPKEKTLKFTAQLSQFTTSDYETSATEAGFENLSWENLFSNETGYIALGKDFWKSCEEKQPYQIFIARKNV